MFIKADNENAGTRILAQDVVNYRVYAAVESIDVAGINRRRQQTGHIPLSFLNPQKIVYTVIDDKQICVKVTSQPVNVRIAKNIGFIRI